jgi:diguanylate cyclase (GGDEF)-like protein/PAS domain S-box-containing protein
LDVTSTEPRLDRGTAVPGLSDDARLAVLSRLPDPVLVVDAAGRLVWGNRAAEVFFDRTLESSVGMSGLDLVHPDDLDVAVLSLLSVQEKEVGLPIEVRLLSHRGWRLVELIGAPLGTPDGALVMSMRDLTDRRTFEVANDDEAKFRSLVHNAAALMMVVSADGRIESTSGALVRLVGRDTDSIVGRPLEQLVTEEHREPLRASLAAAASSRQGGGGATVVEVEVRHGLLGTPIPIELTIVNLLEDPTVRSFVVSGHDLTTRKQVEAELRSTLSLLSSTLDATDDGILVVDRDGVISSFNRRFVELWHLPEGLLADRDDAAAISYVVEQLANPDVFVDKIAELYAHPEAMSHDVLHFRDGRVFDRFSKPHLVEGEIVGRVWCFRDVTERRRLEEQLAHQALHDSLTNLANQSLFRDRVEHALTRTSRGDGNLAVLFLDLDNFKTVNDSLGHAAGDLLLVAVTERLQRCIRTSDTAARLGGDEFAVLLEDPATEQDVIAVAQRIVSSFKRTFTIDGTEVSASVSIGIARATPGASCEQLLRNADLAMYTAKRRGKGRFEAYEDGMHARAVERLTLEAELRQALARGELRPHYQPIVDLDTGATVGVEALARWHHPERGVLAPDVFLELAEEAGLINDVGHTIITNTFTDLRSWQDRGLVGPDFCVSVNLTPHQLLASTLLEELEQAFRTHHVDPACLILEITEGAMMRDTDVAIANLTRLRELGLRIAVDDFGTGYSSLAYLQRFPIDILKIDKSFVDGIDQGPEDSALALAILRLVQTLDLTAIAEGVERESQRDRLRLHGCGLAQGFHFCRPVPAGELAARLAQG